MSLVLSLFDRSGEWPKPYAEAGHRVLTVDLAEALPGTMYPSREHFRCDIRQCGIYGYPQWGEPSFILLAPPCTEFAVSGARWWAEKDRDGRTHGAVILVEVALHYVASRGCRWALENPTGRIAKLVPSLGPVRYSFDPCDHGDAYTKRTHLWGWFNSALPRTPVPPERVCSQGSWVQKLGGKGERTKILRSTTPQGFARAFFFANPLWHGDSSVTHP